MAGRAPPPPGSRPPPGPGAPRPQEPPVGRSRGRSGSTTQPPPPAGRPGPPPGAARPGPPGPPGAPPGAPRPGPPGAARPGPPAPQGGGGRAMPPPAASRPGPPPPGGQRPGAGAGAGRVAPPPGAPRPGGVQPDPMTVGRPVMRKDHRGDILAPGASKSVDALSSTMASTSVGSGGSGTTGGNGNGNGGNGSNGQGKASVVSLSSVGRGITRGRRERANEILRTRPDAIVSKKGTEGDKCDVVANYFRLIVKRDWRLYQYRIDIQPEEDRTIVIKAMVRQHAQALGNYIFDGTMLFSPAQYAQAGPGQTMMMQSKSQEGKTYQISMRLVGELSTTDFHFIQFFNILMRKCLEGLNLQLLGRNYYDPQATQRLPAHKLELWPGYVTSIRQHEQELLMCCEVSNKIIRTETVLDILKKAFKVGKDRFKDVALKELLGAIVITKYNNRTYRIDDIDFNSNPTKTFPNKKTGKDVSFSDYFKDRYNMNVTDKQQPLIVSNPKAADVRRGFDQPVLLVPELCNMTGLSDDQRANFKLMSAVAEYTRTEPRRRVPLLKRFASRMVNTQAVQDELNKWDIKFDTELKKVPARTIKPQSILWAGGRPGEPYKVDNADWSHNFRGCKLFNSTTCSKWAVVFDGKEEQATNNFVKELLTVSKGMGFPLAMPKFVKVANSMAGTICGELHKVAELQPQMIMAVIPNNRGDQYHAIKKVLCCDKPIPSQVMTATVMKKEKGLKSVATKVAIQMAAKLGAEPWAVPIPLKDTMVIGYDSYHDSNTRGLAVGAVVSTINESLTRYTSSCTLHKNDEELLSQLKMCVTQALHRYKKMNNKHPSKIIVYRDGVGDGQIEYVKEQEIAAIRSIFAEMKFEPKLTYVIVSKRINSRFFKVPGPGKQEVNPPSGTIVDDIVTLPERYDFFLVSQSVRQGTVNPTSYNIIEDNSGLRPDHLQMLTYRLTHLYYNWPGTVRVPAVCQYAHKMAFLVGQSLHRKPSEHLEDLLYYL